MVMFMKNLCDYFINLQLFIKDNSKIKTHEQKYPESKYIACGFYFLFCVIVIVYKTFVGCYKFEVFIFTDYLHIGEQPNTFLVFLLCFL